MKTFACYDSDGNEKTRIPGDGLSVEDGIVQIVENNLAIAAYHLAPGEYVTSVVMIKVEENATR